jgi:hypothetical protein
MELTKDCTILQLLSHLKQTFGEGSFQIEDYWDADLCAIGLADVTGSYILYVSTFEKPNHTYYAELEDNRQQGSTGKPTTVFEDLTEKDLEKVFRQYILNGNA